MQFVSPYPTMGHERWYQSQGPTASQLGQMGQGRGQGQGSQVRTSGTQGCVYAIILQTKIIDQLVIQGMFLLLRLWARVLFDFGASHSFVAASCVNKLGLKVETLEESLHVNSPLGTGMRID